MTSISLRSALAASASLLLLAGCQQSEPEVVGGTPDPMAAELANAAPIELPPSIRETRTYRCRDNSLVYVDFFDNDTNANFRREPNAAPTPLVAATDGGPYTAEGGYSVSGSGPSVTIASPGAASQTCNSR